MMIPEMIYEIDRSLIRDDLDEKSRKELIGMKNELIFWIYFHAAKDTDHDL